MKKLTLASILMLCIAIYGCSEEGKEESQGNENKQVESNQTTTEESNKEVEKTIEDGVDEAKFQETLATFPETVPSKIVTTSVPITEMLHLLDIKPVGVPTSTNPIPADFESITKIGSPMAPDLEVISSLQTELIIGSKALKESLDKALEGINLPAAYLSTESYEDLKLSYKVLGTYFGKEKEMNAKLQSIVKKEEELKKAAEGKELPSVMLVIGTSDSFMVMNHKSYLGSLVEKLGAENIAKTVLKAESTYSAIDLEQVVVADPDIIFVLASGDHGANKDKFNQEIAKNSAWTQLSAYKNDNIHMLDYSTFGVTSIANVETALTTISDYFLK